MDELRWLLLRSVDSRRMHMWSSTCSCWVTSLPGIGPSDVQAVRPCDSPELRLACLPYFSIDLGFQIHGQTACPLQPHVHQGHFICSQ